MGTCQDGWRVLAAAVLVRAALDTRRANRRRLREIAAFVHEPHFPVLCALAGIDADRVALTLTRAPRGRRSRQRAAGTPHYHDDFSAAL